MVKIVTWLVRGNDEKATVFWKPKYLDDKVVSQPAAAIYLVANEVDHLSELAASMLGTMKDAITEKQDRLWQEKLDESFHAVKKLSDLLNNYITRLFSSGNLTEEQSEQAAVHLYVSNNIDRIADRCGEVSEICKQMKEEGKQMSEKALSDLRECIRISQSLFEGSMEAVREGNRITHRK